MTANKPLDEQRVREIAFDIIKSNPIPFQGIYGLVETLSSFGGTAYLSAGIPNAPYEQVKIYLNSFTSPSAGSIYIYSNRINKWVSATIGIVG